MCNPQSCVTGRDVSDAGFRFAGTCEVFAYFRAPLPWTELLRRTVVETFEDGIPGLAAQLAFYFLLALFPALLFIVSLLAYLPVDAAIEAIVQRMRPFLPGDVIELIGGEIDKLLRGSSQSLLTFGIAGAIWSSSSALTAVITTLNRAYDIEEFRPWWKARLIAIALSIALAMFAVIAFALVVGGTDLAAAAASWFGAGDVFRRVWTIAQWPIALLFVVLAIDLVYYFAPNADTRWVWVTPGSVLATGLWLLTSLGFKLYLEYVSDLAVVQGAIGSVIVVLLWLYFSGFAMLIGAELNAEIDRAMPTTDESPQTPDQPKKIGPAAEEAAR
jgi:membrane protein